LFVPCRYLKGRADPDYARQCREAIFMTSGSVVVFPVPSIDEITKAEIPIEAPVKEDDADSA